MGPGRPGQGGTREAMPGCTGTSLGHHPGYTLPAAPLYPLYTPSTAARAVSNNWAWGSIRGPQFIGNQSDLRI